MRITPDLNILYEDASILVCVKPAGLPVQTAKPGRTDLVSALKNHRARKGEEPYIGLVHRLDQPVQGIMLFAKTKKAAAALSRQVRSRQIGKEYLAVVCGLPAADHTGTDGLTDGNRTFSGEDGKNRRRASSADSTLHTLPLSGELHDYLLRNGKTNTSRVVAQDTPGAKEALLSYRVIRSNPETGRSLVHIYLHTGRHHQIRVQFAYAGFPLYADTKYGQPLPGGVYCPVALCSFKISFTHPDSEKEMTFAVEHTGLDELV
ncbi:MAG: RluA family pseudouridine synthase [Clostridiales bacterium]|nr:RluA family pseudouridine synthase [Clostridiales bacterium]